MICGRPRARPIETHKDTRSAHSLRGRQGKAMETGSPEGHIVAVRSEDRRREGKRRTPPSVHALRVSQPLTALFRRAWLPAAYSSPRIAVSIDGQAWPSWGYSRRRSEIASALRRSDCRHWRPAALGGGDRSGASPWTTIAPKSPKRAQNKAGKRANPQRHDRKIIEHALSINV